MILRLMCYTGPDTIASCSTRWGPSQPSWSYSTWKSSKKPWEGWLRNFLEGFTCLEFLSRFPYGNFHSRLTDSVLLARFFPVTMSVLLKVELSSCYNPGLHRPHKPPKIGYLCNLSTFSAEPDSILNTRETNFCHCASLSVMSYNCTSGLVPTIQEF